MCYFTSKRCSMGQTSCKIFKDQHQELFCCIKNVPILDGILRFTKNDHSGFAFWWESDDTHNPQPKFVEIQVDSHMIHFDFNMTEHFCSKSTNSYENLTRKTFNNIQSWTVNCGCNLFKKIHHVVRL